MIKTLKKAACGALAALGVFASVCAMTACEKPGPFTPKETGKPDGLWLYCGNSRSRTDGSEKSDILGSVEFGGTVYGADEYAITDINYVVETNEIFYTLRAAERTHVYCYDYKEKTGEIKYTFPDGVDGVKSYFSDTYAYLRGEHVGALFTIDGQFVTDGFYGTLLGDMLYNIDDYGTLTWYRNGEILSSDAARYDERDMHRFNKYLYFFDSKRSYFVDLETGASTWLASLDSDKDLNYGDMHFTGDTLFAVVQYQGKLDGEYGHWYYLYRLSGADVDLVYEFGSAQYYDGVVIKYADGDRMFFHVGDNGYGGRYLCFDIESGIMSDVEKVPTYPERDNKKRVGKYAFYVDELKYAVEGGLLGIEYRTRYYLRRECAGKTDYRQYSDTDKKFFDDICEF